MSFQAVWSDKKCKRAKEGVVITRAHIKIELAKPFKEAVYVKKWEIEKLKIKKIKKIKKIMNKNKLNNKKKQDLVSMMF